MLCHLFLVRSVMIPIKTISKQRCLFVCYPFVSFTILIVVFDVFATVMYISFCIFFFLNFRHMWHVRLVSIGLYSLKGFNIHGFPNYKSCVHLIKVISEHMSYSRKSGLFLFKKELNMSRQCIRQKPKNELNRI